MTDHRDPWNIYLKAMMFTFSTREDGNLLLSQAKRELTTED
jgi:hypothetical protein